MPRKSLFAYAKSLGKKTLRKSLFPVGKSLGKKALRKSLFGFCKESKKLDQKGKERLKQKKAWGTKVWQKKISGKYSVAKLLKEREPLRLKGHILSITIKKQKI